MTIDLSDLKVSRLTRKGPARIGSHACRIGDQWATLWLVYEDPYKKVVKAKAWNDEKPPKLVSIATGRGRSIAEAVAEIYWEEP